MARSANLQLAWHDVRFREVQHEEPTTANGTPSRRGGLRQRILPPAEFEARSLAEQLEQSALYGDSRLFDRTLGTASGLDGSDLVLRQERGVAIRVTEEGSVSLRLPLDEPRPLGRSFDAMSGMVVVEEVVQQRLGTALDFAAGVIDRVDLHNG